MEVKYTSWKRYFDARAGHRFEHRIASFGALDFAIGVFLVKYIRTVPPNDFIVWLVSSAGEEVWKTLRSESKHKMSKMNSQDIQSSIVVVFLPRRHEAPFGKDFRFEIVLWKNKPRFVIRFSSTRVGAST